MSSKSGISRFAAQLLPYLREFAIVEFIATESITDLEKARSLVKSYDHVFVQIGNSPHHKNAFRFVANFPSIILCHDIRLGKTLKNLYLEDKNWMPEFHVLGDVEGDQLDLISLSRVLNLALGVIVQSESASDFLLQ
jgi:hypothetical protein